MANTTITFLDRIGGSRSPADTHGMAVNVEIGGTILQEWIDSLNNETLPAGWSEVGFTPPSIFRLASVDGSIGGVEPIDVDALYICQCSDSNRDRLALTDVEKWVPSLKQIADFA